METNGIAGTAVRDRSIPEPTYWLEELGVACDVLDERYSRGESLKSALERLSPRAIDVMAARLGMNGGRATREKRAELAGAYEHIHDLLYVMRFGKRKSRAAIEETARECLSDEELLHCEITPGRYDRDALLLKIYEKSPERLKNVHLIEKIHKKGFAQMVLVDPPNKSPGTWEDFLTAGAVQDIVNGYDAERTDGRVGLCKGIIRRGGRSLIFVKMEEKFEIFSMKGQSSPGYVPEWIILDMGRDGRNVRISSVTPAASVNIANRITGRYYGRSCRYRNDMEFTHESVILRFLNRICFEEPEKMPCVGIAVRNSKLEGGVTLHIIDPHSTGVGPSVRELTEKIGGMIDDIHNVEWVKVVHRTHVKILFETKADAPGYFVVRYTDNTMLEPERREFEKMMRDEYGLSVLSTEKKFTA